jgi:hypothetical protein
MGPADVAAVTGTHQGSFQGLEATGRRVTVFARIAGRFAQACSRKRGPGVPAGAAVTVGKNGRAIAEFAGDATPDGMQRYWTSTPGRPMSPR